MHRFLVVLCVVATACIASHAYAGTVGDALNKPVPSPANFAPQAIAWFSWLWGKIASYANTIWNMDTNSPSIGLIVKVAKWFWNFSLTTIQQGWTSTLYLGKLLVQSSGIDLSRLRLPVQ